MKVLCVFGLIFMASSLPSVYPALCKPGATGNQPYPGDCSKYVICMAGMEMPMECPSGFHWSVATQNCEWPECAGCIGEAKVPCPRLRPGEVAPTESPTEATTAATEAPPVEITTLDPKNLHCPRRDGLFRYPGDCSRFIQCSNSIPIVQYCPPGLHFNQRLGVCDYPANAGCMP